MCYCKLCGKEAFVTKHIVIDKEWFTHYYCLSGHTWKQRSKLTIDEVIKERYYDKIIQQIPTST